MGDEGKALTEEVLGLVYTVAQLWEKGTGNALNSCFSQTWTRKVGEVRAK